MTSALAAVITPCDALGMKAKSSGEVPSHSATSVLASSCSFGRVVRKNKFGLLSSSA